MNLNLRLLTAPILTLLLAACGTEFTDSSMSKKHAVSLDANAESCPIDSDDVAAFGQTPDEPSKDEEPVDQPDKETPSEDSGKDTGKDPSKDPGQTPDKDPSQNPPKKSGGKCPPKAPKDPKPKSPQEPGKDNGGSKNCPTDKTGNKGCPTGGGSQAPSQDPKPGLTWLDL